MLRNFNGKFSAHLPIVLILLFSGTLSFFLLSKDHRWSGDTVSYIAQGKSALDGSLPEFIEENRFIIDQSGKPQGPYLYPWVFPLLLAAQIALFGESMLAMKGLLLMFHLLFLPVLWYGFREKLDKLSLLILVALFAFNPVMLAFLNSIMSDIPFMFISTVTLLFIGRIFIQGRRTFSKKVDLALLGGLIAFCFFTRTNGILLLPVLLVTQVVETFFVEKKKFSKQLLWELSIPYFSFLAVLILWRLILPAGGSGHLQYLKEISLARILVNLNYYLSLPAEFFSTLPHYRLFYGASLPFFVTGLIKSNRQDYPITIYFFLTMALFIVWPLSHQGLRFILPILPFYIYFLLQGLGHFRHTFADNTRYLWNALLVLLIIVCIFQVKDSFQYAKINMIRNRVIYIHGPFTRSAQAMFSYIKEEIPEDAILVFRRPRVMRYFTGRRIIGEDTRAALQKGDYICFDLRKSSRQLSETNILVFIEEGRIELKYENSSYKIFKILPGRLL